MGLGRLRCLSCSGCQGLGLGLGVRLIVCLLLLLLLLREEPLLPDHMLLILQLLLLNTC